MNLYEIFNCLGLSAGILNNALFIFQLFQLFESSSPKDMRIIIVFYIANKNHMDHHTLQPIKPDPYRFFNCILFVLAALANSIPTQAFSGISPTITKIYNISQFEATIPSLIYPISYIFILIPANYILDKQGLKLGTLICEGCMIIGLLVRVLINVHYYLFCLGTFLCSLGFCFMISGASKFSHMWFPKKEIFMANSLCVFALFASDALGSFLSAYFIREDATREDVYNFFLWQSAIMIIIHLSMAILFKGIPRNIQNLASAVERSPFLQDLKNLIRNRNYLIIFGAITFIFGDMSLIFVFTPWISKTYHYQTISNGIMIISMNLAGCVGCVLVGLFGKMFSYKRKCLILVVGMIVSYFLVWGSFEEGEKNLSYAACGVGGFFGYPLLTTAATFATQTSFPIGEATSGGILLFGGQFMGVILTVIFSQIFDGESLELTRVLLGIIISLFVVGLGFILFTEQILKRDDYENERWKQGNSSLLSQEGKKG